VIDVLQVDAFTTVPYAGNPAGVVLRPGDLTDGQMQRLAREMNLSETAFLLPPTSPEADVRVRWFSPSVEVDLCGHATVALFHAACEAGRIGEGSFVMECRRGGLPVEVRRESGGRIAVRLGLPVPRLEAFDAAGDAAALLRIPVRDLDARLPIRQADREWLLVPVSGLDVLHGLSPSPGELRAFADRTGLGNVVPFSTQVVEPGSAVHLRMFAPAFGIDEDPVTGSAQGPMGAYLTEQGLVAGVAAEPEAPAVYRAEQGDTLGRPGRVRVEVGLQGGRAAAITIQGNAVTVLEARMVTPPRDAPGA